MTTILWLMGGVAAIVVLGFTAAVLFVTFYVERDQ